MADGQRGVLVGAHRQGLVDEQVAGHGADRVEHVFVANAGFAQALDQAVADALRSHALAHGFRLQTQPWRHAEVPSESLRPLTQLATFSSAW